MGQRAGGGTGGSNKMLQYRDPPCAQSSVLKIGSGTLLLGLRRREALVQQSRYRTNFSSRRLARFAASSPPDIDLSTTSHQNHIPSHLTMACSKPTMRPLACWKGFLRQSRQHSIPLRCLSTAPIKPIPRIPPRRLPADTPMKPYVRTYISTPPQHRPKAISSPQPKLTKLSPSAHENKNLPPSPLHQKQPPLRHRRPHRLLPLRPRPHRLPPTPLLPL